MQWNECHPRRRQLPTFYPRLAIKVQKIDGNYLVHGQVLSQPYHLSRGQVSQLQSVQVGENTWPDLKPLRQRCNDALETNKKGNTRGIFFLNENAHLDIRGIVVAYDIEPAVG